MYMQTHNISLFVGTDPMSTLLENKLLVYLKVVQKRGLTSKNIYRG